VLQPCKRCQVRELMGQPVHQPWLAGGQVPGDAPPQSRPSAARRPPSAAINAASPVLDV
jgi:hypothetical protein